MKTGIERKREQLGLDASIPDNEILEIYLNPYDCNEYYITAKEKEKPNYSHSENLNNPVLIDLMSNIYKFNNEFNSWTTGLTEHINDLKMYDLDNCIYLGNSDKLPLKGTLFEYYCYLNDLTQEQGEKIVSENITLGKTLTYTKVGKVENTSHNYKAIFRQDKKIGKLFYYDSFSENIRFSRPAFYRTVDTDNEITDYDLKFLNSYIEDNYGLSNKEKMISALEITAHEKTINRPLRWLNSLVWDGTPRLEQFLQTWYLCEDNPYTRYIFKDWMVNLVSRIKNPGHHYDICLAIIGEQGIGKSLLFRKLATINFDNPREHYYIDMQLTDISKENDIILAMSKGFIFEWKEMQGYSSKNINYIKTFLDKTDDTIRRPYSIFTENIPRRICFGGTTNDVTPLRDKTGNRRFYPVSSNLRKNECLIKDQSKFTTSYKNQLFAEALELSKTYKFGIRPDDMVEIWDKVSEEKLLKYAYEGQIIAYLDSYIPNNFYSMSIKDMVDYYNTYNWNTGKNYMVSDEDIQKRNKVALKEIWDIALNNVYKPLKTSDKIEIENILKKLGYEICSGNYGVYGNVGYIKRTNMDEFDYPW